MPLSLKLILSDYRGGFSVDFGKAPSSSGETCGPDGGKADERGS